MKFGLKLSHILGSYSMQFISYSALQNIVARHTMFDTTTIHGIVGDSEGHARLKHDHWRSIGDINSAAEETSWWQSSLKLSLEIFSGTKSIFDAAFQVS